MTKAMTTLRRPLVTGANGFVGQALCEALRTSGFAVRGTVRTEATPTNENPSNRIETIAVGSMTAETDWAPALAGVEVVIHLAARTQVSHEAAGDLLAIRTRTENEATERLARMSAAQGVKRFIFLSSVKVNGERTFGHPYTEDDAPRPQDIYGISKWKAEQLLARVMRETGLEVVILRAPLVYGPRVKGNFLRLLRLLCRGVPLPLGSIHNRRSLIYVGNLIDAIVTCIDAPVASGKTYLVSDGEDISTPGLLRSLAAALGVRARLFPFPAGLLKACAAILGRNSEIARLVDSLQIDSSKIGVELGWQPPMTLTEGIEQTARWYRR
jgi:nucleoside-diphosphate-sugar epimerase